MEKIAIHSTKYDGSLHWRYPAILLDEGDWGWLTLAPAGLAIETHKGTWLNLHAYLRWHWRERWWDSLLVFKENGQWLEWYCNIITPPQLKDGVLSFQDLDLDVVWHHERGIQIADTVEFEQNAVRMAYPSWLIQQAWDTAQYVRDMMHRRQWRFGENPRNLRYETELERWHVLTT